MRMEIDKRNCLRNNDICYCGLSHWYYAHNFIMLSWEACVYLAAIYLQNVLTTYNYKLKVRMACQKRKVYKYTKPYPSLHLLHYSFSVRKMEGWTMLCIFLFTFIFSLPCLCYYLACHPYISFNFLVCVFFCPCFILSYMWSEQYINKHNLKGSTHSQLL